MYCNHCGTELPAEGRFCSTCGKAVRSASTPRRKPLWLYPLNGAIVVAVVGWLAQRSQEEIVAAAVGGAILGLLVAGVEQAVRAARRP